jgi:hypothetical protein
MPFDTSPKMAALQNELYRQIGETERARIAAELSDALRELAAAGVRQRHPEYGDDEVRAELLEVFYGRRPDAP